LLKQAAAGVLLSVPFGLQTLVKVVVDIRRLIDQLLEPLLFGPRFLVPLVFLRQHAVVKQFSFPSHLVELFCILFFLLDHVVL